MRVLHTSYIQIKKKQKKILFTFSFHFFFLLLLHLSHIIYLFRKSKKWINLYINLIHSFELAIFFFSSSFILFYIFFSLLFLGFFCSSLYPPFLALSLQFCYLKVHLNLFIEISTKFIIKSLILINFFLLKENRNKTLITHSVHHTHIRTLALIAKIIRLTLCYINYIVISNTK